MAKNFYITSAIPYVNAKPHVGHALEFIQTDVVARYHRFIGDKVVKLCGGDENALKNVQAAEKAGEPIKEFVDKNNKLFEDLTHRLDTPYDIWQKGSDTKHHFPSSQKLWELCSANGDIYQKSYKGLYCVGCEAFYTIDELNENKECFEHPGKKLEEVEENNYFFKLSKYQDQLIKLIQTDELKIIPEKRKNEILSFLKGGLEDISISRSNERAKNWGVPVPADDTQRIYVWFDALNIYQSGVGFGWDDTKYKKCWPADIHIIGKGILRFHAVYWPAFLLSAKLDLPKKIFVHEYFTVGGQKMSKTLGNVIDPNDLIDKYGVDPLRYYFLAKFSPFSDGDFSEDKFKEVYNADLANGLGNLISRVAKLCENSDYTNKKDISKYSISLYKGVVDGLEKYRFDESLKNIWDYIDQINVRISEETPWVLTGEALNTALEFYVENIIQIANNLTLFLPQTSIKIVKQFTANKIVSGEILFPRLK